MNYKPNEQEKKETMERLKKLLLQIQIQLFSKVKEDEGAASIEYALLVVVIASVCVLGFELLGGSVKGLLEVANNLLPFGR